MSEKLIFNQNFYCEKCIIVNGKGLEYRAYEGIVYVENPLDEAHQSLNIYVPKCYYLGEHINDYGLSTAPIFFPNTVGGYLPSLPDIPRVEEDGKMNAIARALERGYVVVSAGTRGRSMVDAAGGNIGVAPAHIVDLKAAVRYLRWNKDLIPGDVEKIISNGTSAGGALSALLGATGNHPDYAQYLMEVGAAEERDNIFAASCYCPITNLEHADMAYEWEFCGINEGHWWGKDFALTQDQQRLSKLLKENFTMYVNGLKIFTKQKIASQDSANGNSLSENVILTLDENGNGPLKEYIKDYVAASAQRALSEGIDLTQYPWIFIKDGKVDEINWEGYIQYRTRMKPVPAFDSITMGTPENELFGSYETKNRHFTKFSWENSQVHGKCAELVQVKQMNPMCYVQDEKAEKAKYYRIRHGAVDRDTSLAISAILTAALQMEGVEVDYFLPWGVPHAGDYDLEELFDWIDSIC